MIEKDKEQDESTPMPQQNVSATVPEEVVSREEGEADENAGEDEIPVSVWDLLTGVFVASFILIAPKHRCRRMSC